MTEAHRKTVDGNLSKKYWTEAFFKEDLNNLDYNNSSNELAKHPMPYDL